MKAVILAGGKGARLKPYTTVIPKPLMPIGDKPILEIIIRQLKTQGFKEVIMIIGHLGELIMSFFGDGNKFGINITYVKEDQPLGTVGGLSLIPDKLDDAFLMVNGDTLTTLKFADFIDYHKRNGAIVTAAIKERRVTMDFGVVEVDPNNRLITCYTEKPTLERFVSMGVNAMQPEVLEYTKPNRYMDFPNLIQELIGEGKKVKAYLFDGYWLDIGRPDDYERANIEIEEIYSKFGIG